MAYPGSYSAENTKAESPRAKKPGSFTESEG